MRPVGLEIDRPTIPTAIELSEDEAELKDPQAYPVKVLGLFGMPYPVK